MGLAIKSPSQLKTLQPAQIRNFVPIYSLDPERLQELAKHTRCLPLPAGSRLFSIGDQNTHVLYLLSGSIELCNVTERHSLDAGSDQALMPLDPYNPRRCNAVVTSDAEIAIIDRNLLDILLTWDPYSGYVVNEIDDNVYDPDDWMASILQSKIFQHIPPINIQKMFQKLQACTVKAQDVIFHQGEEGDYYYLIQSGNCVVIRTEGMKQQIIAALAPGQSFGEAALLSYAPRNATVIMQNDGVLLRLAKSDFENLFKRPMVKTITLKQAEDMSASDPLWVDVRQPEEHHQTAIEGSINIPLYRLRESLHELSQERPCIIYCDNGHRSSCAAYLLSAFGYQAFVLENGVAEQTSLVE